MASIWIESRKTPNGTRHRVVWRDVLFKDGEPYNGPRQVGRFTSDPRVADSEFRAKREELELVERGLSPRKPTKTWKEAAALYLDHSEKHKAFKTWKTFDKPVVESFTAFIGDPLVANITTEDIQRWETHLFKTLKPSTVGIRLRVLRACLNYIRKAGWLDKTPHFEIPVGEDAGRVISPDEIEAIFKAMDGPVRRGLTILLYTGMRLGELFELSGENCSNKEATVRTLKRKKGEGQRHRVIPLHQEALKVIGEIKPGPVMPMTRYSFEASFRKRLKPLNLPRTRLHDFRHTWATRYMEATGDLYGLMRLGGWKDLASVERYQHMTKGRSNAMLELNFGLRNTPGPPI